jgi:hypothetical protein
MRKLLSLQETVSAKYLNLELLKRLCLCPRKWYLLVTLQVFSDLNTIQVWRTLLYAEATI